MSDKYDLTYLSLGAGVQSTALLILANQGKTPYPKFAIFADTGDEPQWVYDTLERLQKWSKIPVEITQYGVLSRDTYATLDNPDKKDWVTVPAYVKSEGKSTPVRRQCTREYKITPIYKRVREHLGLKPGQWAKGKFKARCLIGFSMDETQRMKPSRYEWIENAYPLIDLGLRREECEKIVENTLGFKPQRSACVYCPYKSDAEWRELRQHPDEWKRAVEFDNRVRNAGYMNDSQLFMHKSLRPLEEEPWDDEPEDPQKTLWDSFTAECEGMCGL